MLSNNVAALRHKPQTATNHYVFIRPHSCYGNGLDHNLTPCLFTVLDTRSVKFLHYDRLLARCSMPLNNLATHSRYKLLRAAKLLDNPCVLFE